MCSSDLLTRLWAWSSSAPSLQRSWGSQIYPRISPHFTGPLLAFSLFTKFSHLGLVTDGSLGLMPARAEWQKIIGFTHISRRAVKRNFWPASGQVCTCRFASTYCHHPAPFSVVHFKRESRTDVRSRFWVGEECWLCPCYCLRVSWFFILDPKPARVYSDSVMLVTSSGIPLMVP